MRGHCTKRQKTEIERERERERERAMKALFQKRCRSREKLNDSKGSHKRSDKRDGEGGWKNKRKKKRLHLPYR